MSYTPARYPAIRHCEKPKYRYYNSAPYHALNHALQLLRFVHDNCQEFQTNNLNRYLEDATLLSYVEGRIDWDDTREYIKTEEQKWLRKSKKYALYGDEPFRIK